MTKDEYSELKAKIETETENRAANTIPAKLVSKISDGCYTFDFDDGFWGPQAEETAEEPVAEQNLVQVENEVDIQTQVQVTLQTNEALRPAEERFDDDEDRAKSPVSVESCDGEDSVALMVLNVKHRLGKSAKNFCF